MTRLLIDSSNNNPISAAELKSINALGLIAKATEGSGFVDRTYASQRSAARAAHIPFGAYVFLHPTSPGDEAALFVRTAKPRVGDIQPVIDVEVTDGQSMARVAARVDSCAKALEKRGFEPILYGSYSFVLQLMSARPGLKRLPVWEAQYPGRSSRWSLALRKLRMKFGHGISVVAWQFTDALRLPDGRRFDASIVFGRLSSLQIKKPAV